tara:strand:+ start:106 stop:957 length:852 start_codon:yes stop_codon:yes gene_type:complete
MNLKNKKNKSLRYRHNKKRNTAFLYEALVRELTSSVVKHDEKKKKEIVSILKEFFSKSTILYKELELYKALVETKFENNEINVAQRLLSEVKKEYDNLDQQKIFLEQTRVLKRINKALSGNVFSCFVPSYKKLATISQFFNKDTSVKERVLLEQKISESMVTELGESKEMKHIDNLSMKTFLNKFNSTYKETLLPEQKKLLNQYVLSFSDNGISFKVYLNEELERLKEKISLMENMEEVKQDKSMKNKSKEVLQLISDFSKTPVNLNMTKKILKIQKLASEIN